jgi:hypothetical protein
MATWFSKLLDIITASFSNSQTLKTIDIIGDSFFNSMVMSFEDYFTLASGADALIIVVDPTDWEPLGPGVETRIPFEPITLSSDAGPILVEFYAGVEYTGGTTLGSSNRDSTSSTTPVVKLIKDPTITTPGVRFAGDLIPATGAGTGNASNAQNQRSTPFAISNLTKYAIRFTNNDGAGVIMETKLTWSEISG